MDLESVINTWGMIPAEWWRYGGLTFISSFLLHGGWFHLVGNLYFLLIFGDNLQLGGLSNVSALAHLGGAGVGLVAWLIWRRMESRAVDGV